MAKQELRRGGGRKGFWAERRWNGKILRQEGGCGRAIRSARLRGQELGSEGPETLSVRLARRDPAGLVGQVGWQCLQDGCPHQEESERLMRLARLEPQPMPGRGRGRAQSRARSWHWRRVKGVGSTLC